MDGAAVTAVATKATATTGKETKDTKDARREQSEGKGQRDASARQRNPLMDDDGFVRVVARKGKARSGSGRDRGGGGARNGHGNRPHATDEQDKVNEEETNAHEFDAADVAAGVRRMTDALRPRVAVQAWLQALRKRTFARMVILGLGRLAEGGRAAGTPTPPRVQLALALVVASECGVPLSSVASYDPVHSDADGEVLGLAGFSPANVAGRAADDASRVRVEQKSVWRASTDAGDLLLFMPHNDRWLYDRVLCDNKPHLARIAVVGTSFQRYVEMDDGATSDAVRDVAATCAETRLVVRPSTDAERSSFGALDTDAVFAAINDVVVVEFPVVVVAGAADGASGATSPAASPS